MTAPTDEELLSLKARGEFARAMSRRFGLKEESEVRATQVACARLHNTKRMDFLELVERGELQALEGSAFFLAVDFFNRVLPAIEAEPSRIMNCVEALVARGGDDLAAAQPNAALRAWCAEVPARACLIIDQARGGDPLASRNLTFPLEALRDTEQARRFLLSNDDRHRRSAITALSRIPDPDRESQRATLAAFTKLADETDDVLKASLLQASAFLLSQSGAVVGAAELDLLRRLTTEAGDQVIHAAAHVLWAYEGARHNEVVPVLLNAVRGVKPASKGTINQLDHALQSLLDAGFADAVLKFVSELFAGPGELQLTELHGFLQALATGAADLLARAVVSWLLTGEARLCNGLSESLGRGDDTAPTLSVEEEVRSLSGMEQLFVCRKAIGWFFIKPRTAASVAVSVLRVCDDAIAGQVQALLVQPLLVNYGGLREYLQSLDKGDAAGPRVNAALEEDDAYLAELRGVPEIRELFPSEAQRRIQHLRMTDQSRKIIRQARKQSVFLNLVKRSVLLHGRRSLSFITDPDGTLRRFEMNLHPHGVSFELPRMEIVDPVGLDYMLRVFRVERLAQ